MEKSAEAFRTISEVSEFLETPAHVLRFWESRFPQIRPVKRAGGRRYYRPADVALLSGIRRLLHDEGLTIRGVQKILREQGVRHVAGLNDAAQDDAFDAITAAPDAPEQTGFAFDPAEPMGEVIRPVFGGAAAADEPGPADDAGKAEDGEDWPAAEPPLMDQPFADTATDDLPHWGETAPDAVRHEAAEGDDVTGWAGGAAEAGAESEDNLWSAEEDELAAAPLTAESWPEELDGAGAEADDFAAQDDSAAQDHGADDDTAADQGAVEDAPDSSYPAASDYGSDDSARDSDAFAADYPADDAAPPSAREPHPAADPLPTDDAVPALPDAAEATALPPVWLPGLLRSLPPGALQGHQATLQPLVHRLAALRDRMAEAARTSRK